MNKNLVYFTVCEACNDKNLFSFFIYSSTNFTTEYLNLQIYNYSH